MPVTEDTKATMSPLPNPDIGEALAIESAKAVASGSKPRLPRLEPGVKFTVKRTEIELEDAGASVVLQKPSVRAVLDMQEQAGDMENATVKETYGSMVGLVAAMLVEPSINAEEFRQVADELTFSDWQHLQEKALELAGLGEETRRQADEAFPDPR